VQNRIPYYYHSSTPAGFLRNLFATLPTPRRAQYHIAVVAILSNAGKALQIVLTPDVIGPAWELLEETKYIG
jgi:hypothetical protein